MMELLINPRTKARLAAYSNEPGHALLFIGSDGAGKATLARSVAAQLLEIKHTDTENHPFILCKGGETALTIAEVREVKDFLRLKVPGTKQVNRVVILEHIDRAGHEAQNAMLKFIEEPPRGTIILLTASQPHNVLETIISRAHTLDVLPVSQEQAKDYFKDKHTETETTKAYLVSQGNIGLMSAILNQEDTKLTEQIEKAKQLIVGSHFERLQKIDELTKDKESLPYFLNALERICSSGLLAAGNKNHQAAINRWKKSLHAVLTAEKAMERNGNAKLVMSQLFLHL